MYNLFGRIFVALFMRFHSVLRWILILLHAILIQWETISICHSVSLTKASVVIEGENYLSYTKDFTHE
jgi:hypothetical protein